MFPTSAEMKRFSAPMPATVEETITTRQRGWVRFEGTYWFAKFYNPELTVVALPGAIVSVIGRLGNTLLVMPKDEVPEVQFVSAAEGDRLVHLAHSASLAVDHSKTLYVV